MHTEGICEVDVSDSYKEDNSLKEFYQECMECGCKSST
jgi:hypothetical protein